MSTHDPWVPPRTAVADAVEEMDGRKPATIWLLQAFILLTMVPFTMFAWEALENVLGGAKPQTLAIPLGVLGISVGTFIMAGRRSVIGGWLGFFFVAGVLAVSLIGLHVADQEVGGIVRSARNYALVAIILLPPAALLIVLPSSRRVRHYYRAKAVD